MFLKWQIKRGIPGLYLMENSTITGRVETVATLVLWLSKAPWNIRATIRVKDPVAVLV